MYIIQQTIISILKLLTYIFNLTFEIDTYQHNNSQYWFGTKSSTSYVIADKANYLASNLTN